MQAQIALGHMVSTLHILPPPGIAERPDGAQHIAAAKAPDHHRQMHGQQQQAIRQRLQQGYQQGEQQQRRQHRQQHAQPGSAGHSRHRLHRAQQAEPQPVVLQVQARAPAGKFLDQQRQQQHQKTHCDSL
ncbi:hypothetical protein D3C80_1382850 [compost metagenome]